MPETAAGLEAAPPNAPPKVGAAGAPQGGHPPRNNIKETITSLTIAFALAFVFRGFVVEAFLIPTGSMAPTLNGAHIRLGNPSTGLDWAVGPRQSDMASSDTPKPFEGTKANPINVVDPYMRHTIGTTYNERTRAGDRIFVMKYLYSIFDPERFDIVVFKNPTEPQVNFIKRLIGLPGDQLALIDGDVWVRTPSGDDPKDVNPWQLPGWKVASKPELAQRSVWQTVFDSQYAPVGTVDGRLYEGPWRVPSESLGQWDVAGKQDYRFTPKSTDDSTFLFWDYNQPIRDYYAYDEGTTDAHNKYNVGDLALSMGVRPDSDGLAFSMIVQAYRHEFKAEFSGNTVALKMRPAPAPPDHKVSPTETGWKTVATGTLKDPLKAGVVTDVEFWNVDQTMQAYVNGERIAMATYDWTPHQRLVNATNLGEHWAAAIEGDPSLLYSANRYEGSGARLEFTGGGFTISRVALQRDIFYQPDFYRYGKAPGVAHSRTGRPALATSPASVLTLGPDEFFCCGDNSPASLDGRLWDTPDPWVQAIDEKMGIVPRDLLIGKAFFVYFPAPNWRGGVPIPDFGRMRFIW